MSDDAIQRYERELAEDPQSRAFAPLAEAHRKAGNLEEAIRVARTGLEVHPGYSGGLVVLGRALYEKGELDNAAETLQKAVSETPESYLGQKFLGKVLMDKGESKGALIALEAANLLSPEDEEVVRLLDEVKSKATPPEAIKYEGKGAESAEAAQIVTYEQKPTTVDGVELPPLPPSEVENTFSFSVGDTADPADITPVPVEQEVVLDDGEGGEDPDEFIVEDMTATVIDEDEVEQAMEIESLEELGPEAAAFIREGEDVVEDSIEDPSDEELFVVEDVIVTTDDIPSPPADAPAVPVAEEIPNFEAQSIPEPIPGSEPEPQSVTEPSIADITWEEPAQVVTAPSSIPDPVVESPSIQTNEAAIQADDSAPTPPIQEPVQTSQPEPQSAASPLPEPPSPDTVREDEFSTETLADLYAQQGLMEKAVLIYRQILDQTPDNEAVRLKLDALEAQVPSAPGSAQDNQLLEKVQDEPAQADASADKLNVLEGLLENVERMKRP